MLCRTLPSSLQNIHLYRFMHVQLRVAGTQMSARIRRRVCGSHLTKWRHAAVARKRSLSALLHRSLQRILKYFWLRWISVIARTERARAISGRCRVHTLRLWILQWHHCARHLVGARRKRVESVRALKRFKQVVAIRRWRQSAYNKRCSAEAAVIVSELYQRRALTRAWWHLRLCVAHAAHTHRMTTIAEEHSNQRAMFVCFHAWIAWVRRCVQAGDVAVGLLAMRQRHAVAAALRRWRQWAARHAFQLRVVRECVSRTMRNTAMVRAFTVFLNTIVLLACMV